VNVRRAWLCALLTAAVPVACGAAALGLHAAAGALVLDRQSIAGGGGWSSGGAFAVSGTLGQADAEPLQPSAGGPFTVRGGFWASPPAAAPAGGEVFADGFEG
jgi:hypothetical protein